MKVQGILSFVIVSNLLVPTAHASAEDSVRTQDLYSETFEASLFAENGAIQCRNKMESPFGKIPGRVTLTNHGGRLSDRVYDRAQRASRIDYFSMPLPEGVTCAQLEPQIPRGNGHVQVDRKLVGKLVSNTQATHLEIEETLTLKITPEIVLTGRSSFHDFVEPTSHVTPDREIMLQLLDKPEWTEQIDLRLRPLQSGLTCAPVNTGQSKPSFQLQLQVRDGRINTVVVARVFDIEDSCRDRLSDLIAEIQARDIDGRGFAVQVKRDLKLIGRDRLSDNAPGTIRELARMETLSFELLSVKFRGAVAMPLWPSSGGN